MNAEIKICHICQKPIKTGEEIYQQSDGTLVHCNCETLIDNKVKIELPGEEEEDRGVKM